jgi:succinyl-CoA synthetase beta subunit
MAGGRGKGHFLGSGLKGGVKLTKNKNEIADIVKKMLGYKLVTKQTTAEGVEVKKVMVAEALDIRSEKYFAILLDRSSGGPVMVGSPEGGVDIETVAERTPEKIFKIKVDITKGPTDQQTMQMAANLKFEEGALRKQASDIMQKLYKVFIEKDCSQVEINPLIVTDSQTPEVVCLDAKVGLDDNADFRQKDLFGGRDTAEEDPREVKAREFNLNYIGLDGNIGCLVNFTFMLCD